MHTAVVHFSESGSCYISTPYDANFVADLKSAIPPFAREWTASGKKWRIAPDWADVAIKVTRRYFAVVETGKEHAHSQAPPCCDRAHYAPESDYTKLHLLPSAPDEVIKAAYRALAMLYHPDRGGDVAKMQAINAAHERLTK
jgi:hypothetical protein